MAGAWDFWLKMTDFLLSQSPWTKQNFYLEILLVSSYKLVTTGVCCVYKAPLHLLFYSILQQTWLLVINYTPIFQIKYLILSWLRRSVRGRVRIPNQAFILPTLRASHCMRGLLCLWISVSLTGRRVMIVYTYFKCLPNLYNFYLLNRDGVGRMTVDDRRY